MHRRTPFVIRLKDRELAESEVEDGYAYTEQPEAGVDVDPEAEKAEKAE